MPDIFLSYAREDQATAQRFADAFKHAGFDVWWDATLHSGEAYDEVTEKALLDAGAVVVLWSRKSVASRWVRAEATQADRNKTLVPVMIEACNRPIMFELTHTADLSHWKGDVNDPAWRAYVADVRRFVEKDKGGASAPTESNHGGLHRTANAPRRSTRPVVLAAILAGTLLMIGAAYLQWSGRRTDAPVPTSPNPTASATGSGAAAQASAASIAVMPFSNLTGDATQEYFSDGMADELINLLSKVKGLKVASRSSAFAYKGKGTDVRQVARELGVMTVLEGSVRSAGETIRISAQLTDAETGFNLWSESYDRKYSDVFKVQDDLAQQIVAAFKSTMGTNLLDYAAQKPPTDDLEAYSLFLRAQAVGQRNTTDAQLAAIGLLEQAVARDPNFARAYADMASRLLVTARPLDEVERAARRAVELDPSLGAQSLLANVESARRNWLVAAERFAEAAPDGFVTSGPTVAGLLLPTGQLQAALRVQQKLQSDEPANAANSTVLARIYNTLGMDAEAISTADLAVSLGAEPGSGRLLNTRADVAARRGQHGEAAELMVGSLRPSILEAGGADVVRKVYAAMADPSQRSTAVGALRELLKKTDKPENWDLKVWSLAWFAQLGALDDAYATGNALQRQFEPRSPAAAWSWMWTREMSAFRRDPRFQEFMGRLGMMPYWEKYGPPDDCELENGKLSCR